MKIITTYENIMKIMKIEQKRFAPRVHGLHTLSAEVVTISFLNQSPVTSCAERTC